MPIGVYKRTEYHKSRCGFQKGHKIRNTGRTRFKKGQLSPRKDKKFPHLTGKNAYHWKGGRIKYSRGYVYLLRTSHPFCNNVGYVREHRLVMEQMLGRYLTPKEVVHHINSIPYDNKPENLMLFTNNHAHRKFYIIQKGMQNGEIIFDGRDFETPLFADSHEEKAISMLNEDQKELVNQ